MTPLHLAAQEGHTDIVIAGCGSGQGCENKDRETPLHYAEDGYTDIVKLLLDAGADKDEEQGWRAAALCGNFWWSY